jgi:hypothetical protein
VDGVKVFFNKQEFTTDENGLISITDLLEASYKMEITDTRYRLVGSSNFYILSDSLVNVSLVKMLTLTVQVINKTDDAPVYRAVVIINEGVYYSNSYGEVMLNNFSPGPVYISASHNDYYTELDTLAFSNDTVFNLIMTPKLADVTFNISDSNGPVSGAKVDMNSSQTSNSSGQVFFFYQTTRESYDFSVELDSYKQVQGSFYLETDTTIEVMLEKATSNHMMNIQDISIWPNPFNTYIEIDIPVNCMLHIYDVSGIRRASYHVDAGLNTIMTDKLDKGCYILKFVTGEISYNRLIVK